MHTSAWMYSFSVLKRPCKAGTIQLPREISVWSAARYSEAFHKDLTNALASSEDDKCVEISSDDLTPSLMFVVSAESTDGPIVTLYGKNLACEPISCDKRPPVMLLREDLPDPSLCTDNRNPFCSPPSKCEFLGTETGRASHGETGCKFRCECTDDECFRYRSQLAVVVDATAVKVSGAPLQLCGLQRSIFNPHSAP